MDDLLNKIYKEILIYDKDTIQLNKVMNEEVLLLLDEYKEQLSNIEQDTAKEILYAVVPIAELTGFKIGMRFAWKLLSSLSSN